MELTPTQMEALTMYMNRQALGLSQKQIAEQFQISDRQLRRWIATPEAKTFISDQSVAIAKESLNEVLSVLTKRAIEGKTPKWMELYLRICGLFNTSEVEVNVNNNEDRSNEAVNAEIDLLKRQLGIETNESQVQTLTQKQKQDAEIESLLLQLKETEKPSRKLCLVEKK